MLLFKDIKQNYPVYILDTQEFSLYSRQSHSGIVSSIRNERTHEKAAGNDGEFHQKI